MESSQSKDSEEFNRRTTKFIIKQTNIKKVLCILEDVGIAIRYSGNACNTQHISSCYFSDDQHTQYYDKVNKKYDTEILRTRVYDSNTDRIYFEMKNKSLSSSSEPNKERILLTQKELMEVMNKYSDTIKVESNLMQKIKMCIHTKCMKPSVIIAYNRASFSHEGMRMTMDYDMKGQAVSSPNMLNNLLVNEKNQQCGVFYMPLGILEVKTNDNVNPFESNVIKSLIKKGYIKELSCFSKFATFYYYFNAENLTSKPFWYNMIIGDAYEHNRCKNIYPITLKPNTFTSIEALFYRIFNIIIGIPLTLMKYAEITEHVPFLLRPQILKHYLICCLILNLLTFCKVKNRLLNKTINHMGTIFPVLVAFIFIGSLLL